ncbi:MAG: DUF4271 domain-containing protein [Bacteroidetes bacterium]|nr:DUF4271 domain-containing protein [Bacteroidota bacterium]
MILSQNIIESKYHYQPSWVMVLIVLSVMILGYLFSAYNTRFNAFIKTSFSSRFVNQLSQEEYSLSHPTSIFLSVNFLITASLFILQAISIKKILLSFIDFSFLSYLLIVCFLFVIYLIKVLFLKVIGFIFDKSVAVKEYIFLIFLINQLIGIGLIPLIIFIAYGEQSLINSCVHIGFCFFILAFIISIGKGVITAFSGREISGFYLFLYLCLLEILPLLLGIKLFENFA